MKKRCPDCGTVAKLHSDYPISFWQSFFRAIGLIKVKRCSNCNAAVFAFLGVFIISRKTIRTVKTAFFWAVFILLIVITGVVLLKAVVS